MNSQCGLTGQGQPPNRTCQLEDRYSCHTGGTEEKKGVCALSPGIFVADLHSMTNRVFQLGAFVGLKSKACLLLWV